MSKLHNIIRGISLSAIIFASFTLGVFADAARMDFSNVSNGVIRIDYPVSTGKDTKIMVQKGAEIAFYPCGSSNLVPLVFGSGYYSIGIYEQIDGDEYQEMDLVNKDVVIDDASKVFSQKTELVNWSDGQNLTTIAKEITESLKTNEEKAYAVYEYLVKKLIYDEKKAATVSELYDVDAEAVLDSQKGICLDFSVLYASMMRSVGVPTKVVKGYKSDINSYHAWNQVFNEETSNWFTVDVTYDTALVKNKYKTSFIKSGSDYQVCAFY